MVMWGLWLSFLLLGVYVCVRRQDRVRLYNSAWLAGGFLLLCLLAKLGLWIAYRDVFPSLSFWQVLWCLGRGLLPDVLACLWWCGPVLVLLNLPVKSVKWQKTWLAFGFAGLGLFALALAGDIIYFGLVHRHTGSDILNVFTSFSLIWKVVRADYWAALAGGLAAVGLLAWAGVFAAAKTGRPQRGPWFWEAVFLGMLGWACLQPYIAWTYAWIPYGYSYGLEQGHLIQNSVFTMRNQWVLYKRPGAGQKKSQHPSLANTDPDKALQTAKHFLMSSRQEQGVDPQYPLLRKRLKFNADARGRNLIILILESFQWEHVDALSGGATGATPHLDHLIQQGVVFNRFYSCGQDSSLVGIGTILSGVCQISGASYFARGLESVPVSRLGNLFKQQGYQTYFVHPAEHEWMYIGPLAQAMGFAVSSGEDLTPQLSYRSPKTVSDYEAFMKLAAILQQSPQPFLGVFFSLATHEPFEEFAPLTFGNGLEKNFKSDLYVRNLAYTDWALGQFLDQLKQAGLYENTVFVIVGDHPRRGPSYQKLKDFYRVPFVLVAPGILAPGQNDRLASQADILPTLVDLFHIRQPYAAMGNSVFDKSTPEFAFASHMAGEHFGLITRHGMTLETADILPSFQDGLPAQRGQAAELNRAMYDLLRQGRWTPEEISVLK